MQILTPKDRTEMLDGLALNGKSCVEVGVFQGEFSQEILKRDPGVLYLVDPWTHQAPEVYPDDHANLPLEQFDAVYESVRKKFEKDGRVILVRDYSYSASESIPNNSLDFVYIDAVHTFESCLCDALTWYHKVKGGGWLCGHDYTGKYVGVKLAVDAFCRLTGNKLALLTLEPWASWGIKKRG